MINVSQLYESSLLPVGGEAITGSPDAVLCQGEFCLVYRVVSLLKEKNITVLAACSERCVIQNGDRKEVTFSFRRFRRY